MFVEAIQSLERLRGFESEWEDLWQADPEADIFSSADWFLTWWEHFGEVPGPGALVLRDGERYVGVSGRPVAPFVLVAREEGSAVAVLPLVEVVGRWNRLPARILAPPLNNHSARGSLLISAGARGSAARAFVKSLSRRSDWDLLALEGIAAPVLARAGIVEAVEERGFAIRRGGDWGHTVVPIQGSWESYLRGQSHNFRKSLSRAERSLEALGSLRVERHAGVEQVARAAEVFVDVDCESWKATHGETVASSERLRSYYTEVVRRAARRGRAAVWTLSIAEEPIAAILCLQDRQWLYILKSSFKERVGSAYHSPTFVLMKHILEDAWPRGLRGLDFLNRTPFTMRWAKHDLPCQGMLVFRGGMYPGVLRMWDDLHRLRRSLGCKARMVAVEPELP